MAPKRLDAEDTVDSALVFLRALQAEGWGVASLDHRVEHAVVKAGGRKLPVSATVTIRLVPAR